jgi:putative membrane protein
MSPRKPRAIHLDQDDEALAKKPAPTPSPEKPGKNRKPRAQKDLAVLTLIPDEAAQTPPGEDDASLADALTPPPLVKTKRRFSFVKWLLLALGGLVSLGIGLTIDQLVRELFARNTWLGWAAAGFTIVLVLAALGIAIRELFGLARLRKIENLRNEGTKVLELNDQKAAEQLVDKLMNLYESHPDTARGRAKISALDGEIIDGSDLIKLVEQDLISPLDIKARELVMSAAKRVSLVTAISPRAFVDLAYVAMENMRLVRQLSELYGGRPGSLGMFKLARNVIGHLAVTGSIAIGDGIIQQFIGQGLAARLSSRLGEGVINGLLTARVGISAIDLCRPLPFIEQSRPGIGDFMSDLLRFSNKADDKTG